MNWQFIIVDLNKSRTFALIAWKLVFIVTVIFNMHGLVFMGHFRSTPSRPNNIIEEEIPVRQ